MGGLVSRTGPRARLQLGALEDRCTPSAVAFDVGAPSQRVASFVVNDGAIQRSRISSFEINFNQNLALPQNPADAIHLVRTVNGVPTEVALPAMQVSVNRDGNTVMKCVGPSAGDAIIVDGDYKIVLSPSRMSQGLPTDANETVGSFHSLFGDLNGDRTVNQSDYCLYRQQMGLTDTDSSFNSGIDYDSNGTIDYVDWLAFRANYGMSV